MRRFPWTLYAEIAGIANFRPCAQIFVLPPGDRNQYISHREERTTCLHHLNAPITFVYEIASLVLFEFFSRNVNEENCSEFGPANEGAASTGRRGIMQSACYRA